MELWNYLEPHFRYPTDEQLLILDISRSSNDNKI